MAVGIWRSVGNVTRKIKKQHRSVSNVVREIKKEHRGVGNVAKLCFNSNKSYEVIKYLQADSEDTSIVSHSEDISSGTLNLSLTTKSGGGTSASYNGCANGIFIYESDEDWDGLTLSFTLDVTGYIDNYKTTITVGFYGTSGRLEERALNSDGTYQLTIPNGTIRILFNLWCRNVADLTASFTELKIDGELVK